MALPQFSFPLDWRCNGLDFFFRGDKLGTGASVQVYDRAFSLVPSVPRGSARTDAWSGASACVYALSLVPRGCIRMGAWSGASACMFSLVPKGFVAGAILLIGGGDDRATLRITLVVEGCVASNCAKGGGLRDFSKL